ncbi:outer membrane beta-barrel protein, partial [Escherichia coli]
MKKVIVVSALAMAGVFSAQALADRGKTGFYVTGKAGASVVTQTDQRFRQDFGDDVYKYKGGDKNDTVFGAGLAVGYDFYQLKWFTEFGHLNRGDMLTSEQHRCHNE